MEKLSTETSSGLVIPFFNPFPIQLSFILTTSLTKLKKVGFTLIDSGAPLPPDKPSPAIQLLTCKEFPTISKDELSTTTDNEFPSFCKPAPGFINPVLENWVKCNSSVPTTSELL